MVGLSLARNQRRQVSTTAMVYRNTTETGEELPAVRPVPCDMRLINDRLCDDRQVTCGFQVAVEVVGRDEGVEPVTESSRQGSFGGPGSNLQRPGPGPAFRKIQ